MKKFTIFTFLFLFFTSGIAFAAYDSGEVTLADDAGDIVLKLSNNVNLDYAADTDGLGYAVATYHDSGTRTYGSSSGDANIYWIEGTGEAAPDAPSGTDSADFSEWTAL